jgi:hypothetical protein
MVMATSCPILKKYIQMYMYHKCKMCIMHNIFKLEVLLDARVLL